MGATGRPPRRRIGRAARALALGPLLTLLLAPGPALAQPPCSAQLGRLAAGAEASRWRETDADGRTLVREQGRLATLAWQPEGRCAGQAWVAGLQAAAGRRDYDGQTTTGVPLQTHSDIRRLEARLGLRWALGAAEAGGMPAWWTGLGLAQRWLWRDIASRGPVLGYPERFSRWQAEAVLGHRRLLGPGWWLQAELQLAAGPQGRMRLHLPQADAATLRTGSSQGLGLALQLGPVAEAGWSARLHWQAAREGAGPATPLYRGTVLVGGAAQPRVRQDSLGLQAQLRW